ncbi:MAG: hypothetical protein KA715_08055 [Xanthomonadaceae bacterium]|nr:hypothetical protein [Xanthomonadaceae bacterium]
MDLEKILVCNEFFEYLSNSLPSSEQEEALAFVLLHEIMHSYFVEMPDIEYKNNLSKKLNIDQGYLSEILSFISHENVDWGATKLMSVFGYSSIEPAIHYLNALMQHPHFVLLVPRLEEEKYKNRIIKGTQLRMIQLKKSFAEHLDNDETFRKTITGCDSIRVFNVDGSLKRIQGKYQLGSFLEKYIPNGNPELRSHCKIFPSEEIENTVSEYYSELKDLF